MSAESKTQLHLEIAHILFIDFVGYSKLLIEEQRDLLHRLNEVVRGAEHFRAAEAGGKLISLPTGDGMALIFSSNPEAPLCCALEITGALQKDAGINLRMGIHSGPVNEVLDVNERSNVAGAGINTARNIMDYGDAGHILLSKRVADDLGQYAKWQPFLHDLGEVKAKHGRSILIVNFYGAGVGNPQLPKKIKERRRKQGVIGPGRRTAFRRNALWFVLFAAIMGVGLWYLSTEKRAWEFFPLPLQKQQRAEEVPYPEKSIAVLPFENLSDEKANAYFTDGVHNDILTNLAKIAQLKVISRTSVMQYRRSGRNLPEIGQQLRVAYVLEGTVQRAGGKVRVNVQLVDVRTDTQLWAEHYDREVADIFAIQSEIAQAIVDELQPRLSPRERAAIKERPTNDLIAYDLYLRAKELNKDAAYVIRSREKLPEAARLLEQTVLRDPQFMLAFCELAWTQSQIYFFGIDHTSVRLELARIAVENALRLRTDAGEPHLALADYYYHGLRDYDRARTELEIARRTLPNNPEVFALAGYIDRRQGRWSDSNRNLERALELDPRNFFRLQQMAQSYYLQRRYADLLRIHNRALDVQPNDPNTLVDRSQIAFHSRADPQPARDVLEALLKEKPELARGLDDVDYALCDRNPATAARALSHIPREGIMANGINYPFAWYEGLSARSFGDEARARTAFLAARTSVAKAVEDQPNSWPNLSLLGMIDAGLGRKADAIAEGQRACEHLPISRDAIVGPNLVVNLALIYGWTGEKDRALAQLAIAAKAPGSLSYGWLKLHPQWDSLRGDPRFEKIVAALAPRTTDAH